MPARDVRLAVNDVKMFMERLKAILSQ
jgi:hypothetical protein